MSYNIKLENPVDGTTITMDTKHHMKGGTYQVGGSEECRLNITYNYAAQYHKAFDNDRGVRTIYGMSGAASIPILQEAIGRLGNDTNSDYWTATDGNAKLPLIQLLTLAKMRPDGVWNGD